jgi:hypothetical protein
MCVNVYVGFTYMYTANKYTFQPLYVHTHSYIHRCILRHVKIGAFQILQEGRILVQNKTLKNEGMGINQSKDKLPKIVKNEDKKGTLIYMFIYMYTYVYIYISMCIYI